MVSLCVYIHIHTCIYVHIHIHKHAYTHTYIPPTAREANTKPRRHSILWVMGTKAVEVEWPRHEMPLIGKDEPWELTWSAGKSLCSPDRSRLMEWCGQNSVGLG